MTDSIDYEFRPSVTTQPKPVERPIEPAADTSIKKFGVSRRGFLRAAAMGTAAVIAAVGGEAETVEAAGSFEKTTYPKYPSVPTWISVLSSEDVNKPDNERKYKVAQSIIPILVGSPERTQGPVDPNFESGPALIALDGSFPIPNVEVGWAPWLGAPGEKNEVHRDESGKAISGGNNTLLQAHKTPGRGITAPFQNLNEVHEGDIVWVTTVGEKQPDGTYAPQVHSYKVVTTELLPNEPVKDKDGNVVTPGAWDKYGQPTEEEVLTLYGCEGDPIYKRRKVGKRYVRELVNRTHKRCVRAVRV